MGASSSLGACEHQELAPMGRSNRTAAYFMLSRRSMRDWLASSRINPAL